MNAFERIWHAALWTTYHEEVQYQSQPRMSDQKYIQQSNQCSLPQWIYWRVVQEDC